MSGYINQNKRIGKPYLNSCNDVFKNVGTWCIFCFEISSKGTDFSNNGYDRDVLSI